MAEQKEIDLKPVTHITTDAIGKPGQRVFYVQGWKENEIITLIIEKFQLQTLSVGVEQFLAELSQRMPDLSTASGEYEEDQMHIHPPVEPMFRVSEFGLSYDPESDLVGLVAREVPAPAEEDTAEGTVVRYWCTRAQIRALAHWGLEVANRGRPLCPQCQQAMDPSGHFCSKKNGHKR